MSLWVVVGGQFGSEGKGKISAFITQQEQIDICVRCGGPNSGHSFVDENGIYQTLRQLPTGFIRQQTRLLLPAGALIDIEILRSEIERFKLSPARLGIDVNCMVIEQQDQETEARLHMQERLSSTLTGVGSAVARRALRTPDVRLIQDVFTENRWLKEYVVNVSDEVNVALDKQRKVLIEGTQGSGLSVYHSKFYPKATSRDTNAAGFLSEVGVSPLRVTEIVLVFRTFPIRVAGNQAGPLFHEISWEEIQQKSGYPTPLHEYTTVTRKLRRVGKFDFEQASQSVRLNRPTRLALNFMDYLDYSNSMAKDITEFTESSRRFIAKIESAFHMQISYYGVGPRLKQTFSWAADQRLIVNSGGYI